MLYASTHQFPFYPGTGAADETGVGAGGGFTVNLPISAGAVSDDYRLVFAEVLLPVVRQFKPDLVLVSAGFDAHERDPLAHMRLTTDTFAAMTMELRAVADECCDGRMVLVTEGGYDLAGARRVPERRRADARRPARSRRVAEERGGFHAGARLCRRGETGARAILAFLVAQALMAITATGSHSAA